MKTIKLIFVALIVISAKSVNATNYIDENFNSTYKNASSYLEPLRKQYNTASDYIKRENDNKEREETESEVKVGFSKEINTLSKTVEEKYNTLAEQIIYNYQLKKANRNALNKKIKALQHPDAEIKEGTVLESWSIFFDDYGLIGGVIAIVFLFAALRYSMVHKY